MNALPIPYRREAIDRNAFSKGTKGWWGVCSAPGCLRNARWSFLTIVHYHYGPGVYRLARCDLHGLPQPLKKWRKREGDESVPRLTLRERLTLESRRLGDMMKPEMHEAPS